MSESIRKYLSVIKRAVTLIEAELGGGVSVEPAPTLEVQSAAPTPKAVKKLDWRAAHVQKLMEIDCWPEAMPSILTVTPSEKDQKNRASAVMDMVLDRSLEQLHFLDFGCGEGWITQEALKRGAATATGFDLVKNERWSKLTGPHFIHEASEVRTGFYDVVLLYDVLDHCQNPVEVMEKVRASLTKTGVVYVRCHPWTARHVTHLYKQGLNKAFIHLFLDWDEIREIIRQDPMFTRIEKAPLDAYRWWFKDFRIIKERLVKEPVHEFFQVDSFKELLAKEQQVDAEQLLQNMEIQFVDFVLALK